MRGFARFLVKTPLDQSVCVHSSVSPKRPLLLAPEDFLLDAPGTPYAHSAVKGASVKLEDSFPAFTSRGTHPWEALGKAALQSVGRGLY